MPVSAKAKTAPRISLQNSIYLSDAEGPSTLRKTLASFRFIFIEAMRWVGRLEAFSRVD